jgi:hypothetical protein
VLGYDGIVTNRDLVGDVNHRVVGSSSIRQSLPTFSLKGVDEHIHPHMAAGSAQNDLPPSE